MSQTFFSLNYRSLQSDRNKWSIITKICKTASFTAKSRPAESDGKRKSKHNMQKIKQGEITGVAMS